jgi:hypothetical protein
MFSTHLGAIWEVPVYFYCEWGAMKRDPVICVFVLAIMVSGCDFHPFRVLLGREHARKSDPRHLNLLKKESLAVAETITKKSPDSFVVTREQCTFHNLDEWCYYKAKYSFPDISAEELRLMAENDGWSPDPRSLPSTPEGSHLHPSMRESFAKYLRHKKYRYCSNMLEVNHDELTVYCYKKK